MSSSDTKDKDYYLFSVILFSVAIYFVLIFIIFIVLNKILYKKTLSLSSYLRGLPFELTYLSWTRPIFSSILFFIRIIFSILYIAIYILQLFYINNNTEIITNFFLWTSFICAVYFILSSTCSFIGYRYEISRQEKIQTLLSLYNYNNTNEIKFSFWRKNTYRFGSFVQILYAISGSNAIYSTLLFYIYIKEPNSVFLWNNISILFLSMSYLLDLCLNNIVPRWEWIILNETWIILYYCFLWISISYNKDEDSSSSISTSSSIFYNLFQFYEIKSLRNYCIYFFIRCSVYFFWCGLHWIRASFQIEEKEENDEEINNREIISDFNNNKQKIYNYRDKIDARIYNIYEDTERFPTVPSFVYNI